MTANVNGVNLTLMIGPAVPVPVSLDVLDALDSVKVISKAVGTSGFDMRALNGLITCSRNSALLR